MNYLWQSTSPADVSEHKLHEWEEITAHTSSFAYYKFIGLELKPFFFVQRDELSLTKRFKQSNVDNIQLRLHTARFWFAKIDSEKQPFSWSLS